MKFSLHQLSLGRLANALCLILALLVIINFLVYWRYQTLLKRGDHMIAFARQTAVLTQQIPLWTHQLELQDPKASIVLPDLIHDLDQALRILDKGGRIPDTDVLFRSSSDIIRSDIDEVIEAWGPLKKQSDKVRGQEQEDSLAVGEISVTTGLVEAGQNAQYMLSSMGLLIADLEKDNQARNSRLTTILFILMVLLLGTLAASLILLSKQLFQPLENVAACADKISAGDLEVRAAYDRPDEIGRLAKMVNHLAHNVKSAANSIINIGDGKTEVDFEQINKGDIKKGSLSEALKIMQDRMKEVSEEEKKRNWANEGLNLFVNILKQNYEDTKSLCKDIIANLVSYTGSNQGSIYLLEGEEGKEQHLELASLYAFDIHKHRSNSIKLGQGLLGQTFLEAKTTYLLEVPEDYIQITSGLGKSNPRAILIVPLLLNEQAYGVMEIASFEPYPDHVIAFAEQLAENLASSIGNVKSNERTQKLLEESQLITEQMKAQEEEMRQNMEELAATQEEMSRKENRMTAQLNAIDNSILVAEIDNQRNFQKVNKVFAQALGYTTEGIDGLTLGSVWSNSNEVDLSSFWDSMAQTKTSNGNFKLLSKAGNELDFWLSFTASSNENGQLSVVIVLGRPLESESSSNQLDELGLQLNQQLEAAQIAHVALDEKRSALDQVLPALKNSTSSLEVDSNGVIQALSEPFSVLTGWELGELKGSRLDELTGNGSWEKILAAPDYQSIDFDIKSKGGNIVHASVISIKARTMTESNFIIFLVPSP